MIKKKYKTSLVFLFLWNKVKQVYMNMELMRFSPTIVGGTTNNLLPPHLV
jgi:hypothetical protein